MSRTLRALWLPGALLIALSPWIFFDFDMGDLGWNALAARLMAFPSSSPMVPVWFEVSPIWFSAWVGSLWWKVLGPDATLLELRWGWVLWNVAIATFAAQIFRRRWSSHVTTAVFLGAIVACSGADMFTLAYNNIAPALGALGFLFLAIGDPTRITTAITGAFFLSLAILGRFSALPFLGVGMGVWWILRPNRRQNALGLATGGFFSLLLSAAIILMSDQWDSSIAGVSSFFQGVGSGTNARYSLTRIFGTFAGHSAKLLFGAGMFFSLEWALEKKLKTALLVMIPGFFALGLWKYGSLLAILLGGALAVLGREVFRSWKSPNRNQVTLEFVFAATMLVAFTFGTHLEGLQNHKFSALFVVPLAFLVSHKPSRLLLVAGAVSLFLCTRLLWPAYPYLEAPVTWQRSEIETPFLRGVMTHHTKAEAVGSLVKELQRRNVKVDESLFAYSGTSPFYPISTIHLILGTRPWLNDPAPSEYSVNRWPRVFRLLQTAEQNGSFPRFVVRQNVMLPRLEPSPRLLFTSPPSSANTPLADFAWATGEIIHPATDLDGYFRKNGWRPTWHNGVFSILEKN